MEAIKANISTDEYLQVQNLLDSYKSGLLEKVLVALYNEEHKQSELAKLVDSTPASLANLMHKFDDTDEKIIIKKRRGRAQYYSLSKAAQQYVQQNLLLFSMDTKRIPITKNVSIEENMQAFQSLFREFCEISGNDWDEYLFTLLDKRPNRFDVSIQKAYQKLYDEAKRLFINNGEKNSASNRKNN